MSRHLFVCANRSLSFHCGCRLRTFSLCKAGRFQCRLWFVPPLRLVTVCRSCRLNLWATPPYLQPSKSAARRIQMNEFLPSVQSRRLPLTIVVVVFQRSSSAETFRHAGSFSGAFECITVQRDHPRCESREGYRIPSTGNQQGKKDNR